jgi:hypothetical protein
MRSAFALRSDVVLLQELAQLYLARLQRLPRLVHLGGQEPRGVLARVFLVVELLGDDRVGHRVHDLRGQLGTAAVERDLDQPRVPDRLDLEPVEELLGQLPRPTSDRAKLRMVLEVQERDDPVGERAALQEAVVRLHLGLRRLAPAVVAPGRLELEDPGLLLVDPEQRGGRVHGPRGQAPDERGEHGSHEHQDHRPSVPHDHVPVVPEMRLAFPAAAVVRLEPGRRELDREVPAVRQRAMSCVAHIPFATPRAPLKKSMNP